MSNRPVSNQADNPIYQRLTRNIDARKQRAQVRLAAAIPAVAVMMVTVVPVLPGSAGWLSDTLIIAGIGMLLSGLVAIPVATGAASGALAHAEVRGETFGLIQLTPLTHDAIKTGLVRGIKQRLKPLRTAADSLAISVVAVPFAVGVIGGIVSTFRSGSTDSIGILVFYIFMGAMFCVVIDLFVFAGVHLYSDLGVLAGIYCVLRMPETSVTTSAVAAACIVLGAEVILPLLATSTAIAGQGLFSLSLCCIPFSFAGTPGFGCLILHERIDKTLRRMRPAVS